MPLASGELESLRAPLLEGLRALQGEEGWPLPPEPLTEALLEYTEELFKFNEKLGLVESTPSEFVHAHLLDSLAPVAALPPASRARLLRGSAALDAGSGAGLPGIPLALAFPELQMTLLDRSGRRCGFLRNALAILGRRDVGVFQGTLREARRRRGATVELLVARAFHPLDRRLYEELSGLLVPGGEIMLYKGRREQAEEEVETLREQLQERDAEPPETSIEEVEVPGLGRERTVLLIREGG